MTAMTRSLSFIVSRRIAALVTLGVAASCTNYEAIPIDPCRPQVVIPTLQSSIVYFGENGSIVPSCDIDDNGVVTMQYTPLSCSPTIGWYGGCFLAANQDLSQFDALTGGGHGVLAVKLCVKDFVPSSLNLRYGSPAFAANGRTKYMPIIPAEEQFAGNSCRLVYLSPHDACYSLGRCGPNTGCPTEQNTDLGNSCDTFSRSQLTIVNEFCVPSRAAATKPTTVTIEKITYYPAGCTCEDTGSCAAPNVCRRDGWRADAKCENAGSGCPGVCAP